MSDVPSSEALQQAHYDDIAERYRSHYGDRWSQLYRREFIDEPLFSNVPLRGATVVEGMCGAGETTAFLLERGARVIGVDISMEQISAFEERWPQCEGRCASMLETGLADASCDLVAVVGGLHHLHPNVSETVEEIHRILRPGGAFCFVEPHRGAWIDRLRRVVYRLDPLFADNEESVDVQELRQRFADRFTVEYESYRGGPAYLLVLQSMIFRMPITWKRFYARPLMSVERALLRVQGPRTSCFVLGCWRKRQTEPTD